MGVSELRACGNQIKWMWSASVASNSLKECEGENKNIQKCTFQIFLFHLFAFCVFFCTLHNVALWLK